MSFGLLFSFGLFLTPLAETFDASTAAVASVFSGSVLCYYAAGAVGGAVSDRRGARSVVVFGAVALPGGLILASFAPSLWVLFALYAPLVGCAVGSCYAPLIGAVGRALPSRQGQDLSVRGPGPQRTTERPHRTALTSPPTQPAA
ncbi:MAG: MFS transporter [Actinomycetota bacterium]